MIRMLTEIREQDEKEEAEYRRNAQMQVYIIKELWIPLKT